MSINLKTIPANLRKPGSYIEFNTRAGGRGLPTNEQKVLMLAQRLSSGSKPAGAPVQVFSKSDAQDYFGAGSVAHVMCIAAFNKNKYIKLFVLPMDDAESSVAATGSIAISGAPAAAGQITLAIAGTKLTVNLSATDTATDIATALVAAIAAKPELPVTASASSGTITVTAKNKGTVGNQITLRTSVTVTGLTITITAMATGATDPDYTTALATAAGERFHIIASSLNSQTALTALGTYLNTMAGAMTQKPGMGVFSITGALASGVTLTGALNAWLLTGAYQRGAKSWLPAMAAVYSAILAAEEDPAMPLNGLELDGIVAPDIADRLSPDEQETCLANGLTPLDVSNDETVRIVRAITTYTKDSANVSDPTLLDVTTPRTLFYVRDAVITRITAKFPRAKLSKRTPSLVKTEVDDVLGRLEAAEIIENVADNPSTVERDETDKNRLNVVIPADVVNGLHIVAGSIDLII